MIFFGFAVRESAFAAGGSPKRAVVTVSMDSATSETLYLVRAGRRGLESVSIDSAKIGKGRLFELRVIPDPTAKYGLKLGDTYLAYPLFLAAGDVLHYQHRAGNTDTLLYDKFGANQVYGRDTAHPASQDEFYAQMGTPDWDGMQAYCTRWHDKIAKREPELRRQFPEHPALADVYHCDAIHWYLSPLLYKLQRSYSDDTAASLPPGDPDGSKLLGSIPWVDTTFQNSQELDGFASQWLDASLSLWRN